MMLTTSAAWFEATLAATRAAANLRDALHAFHAADSALTLCARIVMAGAASVMSHFAARSPSDGSSNRYSRQAP